MKNLHIKSKNTDSFDLSWYWGRMTNVETHIFGYARASIEGPDLAEQLDALARLGVAGGRTFSDPATGTRMTRRAGFKALLDALTAGSLLIVASLDRLGGSATELVSIVALLRGREVDLVTVAEGIDTRTEAGTGLFGLVEVLARFESAQRSERKQAGVERARARGNGPGRPSVISGEARARIVTLMLEGRSFDEIASVVGVSRASLYNHGAELRAEVSKIKEVDTDEG